jgi:hypothetical protein
MVLDLPEIFDCIILISYRNGRAQIDQADCRARSVFKLDFELSLSPHETDFTLPPGGIVAGPAVLIFMF